MTITDIHIYLRRNPSMFAQIPQVLSGVVVVVLELLSAYLVLLATYPMRCEKKLGFPSYSPDSLGEFNAL